MHRVVCNAIYGFAGLRMTGRTGQGWAGCVASTAAAAVGDDGGRRAEERRRPAGCVTICWAGLKTATVAVFTTAGKGKEPGSPESCVKTCSLSSRRRPSASGWRRW